MSRPMLAFTAPYQVSALSLSLVQGILLLIILVVGAVIVIGAFTWIIIPRMVRSRRAAIMDGASWAEDRAWNQIQAAQGLASYLEGEGVDVRQAQSLVAQAQGKYEMKRYGDAQNLAKQATEDMSARRKSKMSTDKKPAPVAPLPTSSSASAPAERERPAFRDVSRRVGDPDPEAAPATSKASVAVAAPTPSRVGPGAQQEPSMAPDEEAPPSEGEEENATVVERRKLPRNYMEARFMIKSLQDDLQAAAPELRDGPMGKEALDWAKQSQAAFDRKDYDGALRLALRGRRRIGGGGLSTISVSSGTMVDAPPEEATPGALRSSAPPLVTPAGAPAPLSPTSVACKRCGRSNQQTDRFCRGCGAQLSEPQCPRCQKVVQTSDQFCHFCGAPLGGAPP